MKIDVSTFVQGYKGEEHGDIRQYEALAHLPDEDPF